MKLCKITVICLILILTAISGYAKDELQLMHNWETTLDEILAIEGMPINSDEQILSVESIPFLPNYEIRCNILSYERKFEGLKFNLEYTFINNKLISMLYLIKDRKSINLEDTQAILKNLDDLILETFCDGKYVLKNFLIENDPNRRLVFYRLIQTSDSYAWLLMRYGNNTIHDLTICRSHSLDFQNFGYEKKFVEAWESNEYEKGDVKCFDTGR